MPNITVREYHPESGSLLGNISVLDFGKITAGSTSRVKVIDLVFSEATSVGNIKIGLISNGGITANESVEDVGSDGSSSTGHFGIETIPSFLSTKASEPLTRHFAGVNSSGTSDSEYNVSVGTRNSVISNYIYLDIEVGSTNIISGNGAYKVFFDYA